MVGERSQGNPVIVDETLHGKVETLSRIALAEKEISEFDLQELIRTHPAILPLSELDDVYAPPISIGREVSVEDGAVDNLLISPSGYLTLVEAKLWRNPEARRKVFAQIIDYAKDVTNWTWDDLDERVREYNKAYNGKEEGLLEMVRPEDEAAFIDRVQRNLRAGRMLLLIVGDGIRENVESMAGFLQGFPSLLFTLGLVELKVYRLDDERLIVVPNIVARTREIVRAVVKVEGRDIEKVEVSVDTSTESGGRTMRRTLTEDEFFEILGESVKENDVDFARRIISDMHGIGCEIDWKSASYVVKYPDPKGSSQKLTLFVVTSDGTIYTGWLNQQMETVGIPKEMGFEYVARSAELMGTEPKENSPEAWMDYIPLSRVEKNYDAFVNEIERFIEQIEEYSKE